MNILEINIGNRLFALRKEVGITQEELGRKLGLDKTTISAYELDKIDIKVSIIKEIAQILGTTVGYLVDGDENVLSSDIVQMVLLL